MTRILLRRGTASQWRAANPVLAAGEPGFELDTGRHKIGDGHRAWDRLDAFVTEADLASELDRRIKGSPPAELVNAPALGRWWAACHRAATTRPGIVFLGSSTTEGAGASTSRTRWVNRFVERLQAHHPSGAVETEVMRLGIAPTEVPARPGIQAFNGGIWGRTSGTYCSSAHLYGIGVFDPTLVVHMIGSNDSTSGVHHVPVDEFRRNVESAVDAIGRRRCHLFVHSFRRFEAGVTAEQWAGYGRALREVATARANVAFVDLSGYGEEAQRDGDPSQIIADDGVHPSDTGHALLADLTARALGLTAVSSSVLPRDTGWLRIVTAAGWRPADEDGYCLLRRTGDRVTVRFRLAPQAALGADRTARHEVLVLPAGFRAPGRECQGQVVDAEAARSGPLGTWTDRARLSLRMSPLVRPPEDARDDAWAPTDVVSGQVEWTTDEAWPEVLPGAPR